MKALLPGRPGEASLDRRGTVRLAGLGLALALAGCGFRPMYGGRDSTSVPVPPIRVALIPDREGQILREGLRERLGRDVVRTGTPHDLSVLLSFDSSEVGIRADGTATRTRILGSARFRLVADGVQEPVLVGVSRTLDAVNLLDLEFFASQLAVESARRRIVEALAEDISMRVTAHFARTAAR